MASSILAAGLSGPAAAAPDAECLWSQLPPHAQLRLELAVLRQAPPPLEMVETMGAQWLGDMLYSCGFPVRPRTIDFMLRFWGVRAALPVYRAELEAMGVDPSAADAALREAAPPETISAMAQRIGSADVSAAARALRAAIAAVGPMSAEAEQALARYLTAKLMVGAFAVLALETFQ